MSKLKLGMRNIDVELTNRCNAQCTFCPRDQTPDQGFMTFETFQKTVERALELEVTPKFHSAGQGEPTLHPELPKFAQFMKSEGLEYGFTTNGSLLTEELSHEILDASVEHIVFSISDLGEDYEEVYALSYDATRENIFRFLDMNDARGKPVRVEVSLVTHDLNREKLANYKKFWREAGIEKFHEFNQTNRAGACDNGNYFVGNSTHMDEAAKILADNNISHVCSVPYLLLFVGWNGQYYLCCNDYRKLTPLGSVFDHSILEMDAIKKSQFFGSEPPVACKDCDLDVTNKVREVLFQVEAGEADASKIDRLVAKLQKSESMLEPLGGDRFRDFVIARESA